jgi:hypothetical protein
MVLCSHVSLCSAAGAAGSAEGQSKGQCSELILCGGDEVYILDLATEDDGRPEKVWSWRAKDRPELPGHLQGVEFAGTDECKPVDGGRKILITSSGSGVALVDRQTGEALFWAVAENAHSADMLPGDRIAVATSGHEMAAPPRNPNRLIIYDAKTSEKELYSTELPYGHGVVWDEQRQLVWALSGRDVRAYRLVEWETDHPSLEFIAVVDLPEGGGHDLYPLPHSPLMTVTTVSHCWLFDRDKRSFRLHPQLGEAGYVKSISVNPVTGQIAYVQSEGENWWAERVRLLDAAGELHRPGERVYKARWNAPTR